MSIRNDILERRSRLSPPKLLPERRVSGRYSKSSAIHRELKQTASLPNGSSLTGEPSPQPQLPLQYSDFAAWQGDYLQGESFETQLGYWRKQFGGLLPVLQLPTDRRRPAIPTYNVGLHSMVMSRALMVALKALSKSEEVTLFTMLLAAFQAHSTATRVRKIS